MNEKNIAGTVLNVLSIEDSVRDFEIIREQLIDAGYHLNISRVETKKELESSIRGNQYDIILADFKLPGFDAFGALRLCNAICPEVPFICISGAIGEETAIELIKQGAVDYVLKDRMARLPSAVKRALDEVKRKKRIRQDEEALKKSENKYRLLADNIHDVIFVLDMNLNYTYISPSVKILRGYEQEEALKHTLADTLTPSSMDLFLSTLSEVMEMEKSGHRDTNLSRTLQLEMKRKEGTTVWTEVKASFIRNENQRPIGIMGAIRDITERKKAEEEVRESEIKFRTIFEFANDTIFLMDKDIFIDCNQKTLEMFGCTREQIIGQPPYRFSPEVQPDGKNSKEKTLEKINAAINGQPQFLEWQLCRYDGTLFDAEVSLNSFNYRSKYYIQAIVRDITYRKKVEEALRNSEEKYRDIFENAVEGIYQSTMEGRLITANAAFARMAGYDSPEELIESIKDMGTQLYVNSEDRERVMKTIETKSFVEGFEVEFYKKDGSKFWVVINARTVKDEQGEILYIEGLIEDITIRKYAEEQLQQTLESLRKAVGTTIQVLVSAIESRDPYTAGHQLRVADLARAIVTEMGLPHDSIEGIRMAGSIHDIGKLSIPAEILSKPTKLTEIEFSLIKAHAQSGYEMLKNVESPWPLAQIVYQHHERMDGSGYPRNLKGDEILIEARIMAVADVVEAMASHRPYRPGLGMDAALAEIEKNKGTHYDNTVADACLRLFREKGYQFK